MYLLWGRQAGSHGSVNKDREHSTLVEGANDIANTCEEQYLVQDSKILSTTSTFYGVYPSVSALLETFSTTITIINRNIQKFKIVEGYKIWESSGYVDYLDRASESGKTNEITKEKNSFWYLST